MNGWALGTNLLSLIICLIAIFRFNRLARPAFVRLEVTPSKVLAGLLLFVLINGAAVVFLSVNFGMIAAGFGLALAISLAVLPDLLARLLGEAASNRARRVELELQTYELKKKVIEAQETEKELRRFEARFRRLTDTADDMIFVYCLNPQPHFEFVNQAAAKVLGVSRDDFFEDPFTLSGLIADRDSEKLSTYLSSDLTQPASATLHWIKPDGRYVWTEAIFRPVRDESGRTISVEANLRDVTLRMLTEEARDRERRWLSIVFDHAPVGMLLVRLDESGKEVFQANRRFKELLGRTTDWSLGREAYNGLFYEPNGNPIPFEKLPSSQALRGNSPPPQEVLVKKADGTEVALIAHAKPILDSERRVEGMVGAVEDITGQKVLERLREEWTSVVAHDLRSPISTISMSSGLLKMAIEQGKVESIREVTGFLESSASQLERFVGDLLDASRLEARNLSLERTHLDLNLLLGRLVKKLQPQNPHRPIHYMVKGDEHKVFADPERIEQVVTNLLTNAVKYGYEKSAIELILDSSPPETRVAVTNKGKGIPPENIGRLFSRFQRTDWAKKQKIKGIGLGLYITRGLVEAHGGRVHVESTPGGTTTFSFSLPKNGFAAEHSKPAR